MYSIEVTPAADRELDRLKRRIQRRDFERLRVAIRDLANEPRPEGVRKLRGEEWTWRIRVGQYRVVYDIDDDRGLVVVLRVARRSETTYR